MRSIMMILGLLFIALSHPSFAQSTETAAATVPPAAAPAPAPAPADEAPSEWREFVYELHRAIELSCKPGGGADAPAGIYTWKANGTAVGPAGALAGRHELREGDAVLAVPRSTEDDWGNYTCLVDGAPVRGYRVRARPVLRLPADSNVVEGQKLKLTCRVLGRPYPAVSWTYSPDVSVNATDVEEALGDRVKLQTSAAGVERGDLVIEAAQRGDAGLYSCRVPDAPAPSAPAPGAEPAAPPAAATVLRVKDMYAALWPFLGICAEVFILCAIILVYEKRRTKPELDDSDTDNHDQKES